MTVKDYYEVIRDIDRLAALVDAEGAVTIDHDDAEQIWALLLDYKDLLGIVDCIQPAVVLCKDCKFYKDKKFIFMIADWKFHEAGKCQLRELYGIEEVVFPDYFCGDGKWREDKDG